MIQMHQKELVHQRYRIHNYVVLQDLEIPLHAPPEAADVLLQKFALLKTHLWDSGSQVACSGVSILDHHELPIRHKFGLDILLSVDKYDPEHLLGLGLVTV